MKIKDIGEIGLIERFAKAIALDRSVVKGIGDDAAVIRFSRGRYLLFASDMLIEGVHFTLRSASAFQIGWKALAVNVSDIAAMGGVPRHAVVSIGVRPDLDVSFAEGLYRGLRAVAKRFGINIVGGDTNSSRTLVIDVSVMGEVEKKNLVTRSGAREGDLVLVTGRLGGSLKGRHLDFLPRLREARALVRRFRVTSMIDVSDGLVLDLGRVLKASSVGCRLYANAIPVTQGVSLGHALTDGEDFELLFTMSALEARRFFKRSFRTFGTEVSIIGEVLKKTEGFTLLDGKGSLKRLSPEGGYTHF